MQHRQAASRNTGNNNVSVDYRPTASYSTHANNGFAQEVRALLVPAIHSSGYLTAVVRSFTPPGLSASMGYLELDLFDETDKEWAIGIVFGGRERQLPGLDTWITYPMDPHSLGLEAADFDEAWGVVVGLLDGLRLKEIRLSYGY